MAWQCLPNVWYWNQSDSNIITPHLLLPLFIQPKRLANYLQDKQTLHLNENKFETNETEEKLILHKRYAPNLNFYTTYNIVCVAIQPATLLPSTTYERNLIRKRKPEKITIKPQFFFFNIARAKQILFRYLTAEVNKYTRRRWQRRGDITKQT